MRFFHDSGDRSVRVLRATVGSCQIGAVIGVVAAAVLAVAIYFIAA